MANKTTETAKTTATKATATAKTTAKKAATTVKATAKKTTSTAKKAVTTAKKTTKKVAATAKKKAVTAKKAVAKKTSISNIDKIVATGKEVNKEVTNTANEIMEDIRENTMEIRETAAKTIKKVTDKVGLTENIEKVKKTAEKVNKKVTKVANEVVADVYANGEQLADDAVAKVKTAINEFSVKGTFNKAKSAVYNANEYSVGVADNLVDSALKNGEKWQKVADKAVKGGLKLAAKQQELMFNNLEEAKDQTVKSVTRFARLFK